MGAGFCLLEVFGINQCAILFGATWWVNTVVISSILIMILIANQLEGRISKLFNEMVFFILLIIYLVFVLKFDLATYIAQPASVKGAISLLLFGVPMFLSGLAFAQVFAASSNRALAIGANMFGALIGGALQLITFRFGIKSLVVLAMVFYLVALTSTISRKGKIGLVLFRH